MENHRFIYIYIYIYNLKKMGFYKYISEYWCRKMAGDEKVPKELPGFDGELLLRDVEATCLLLGRLCVCLTA